MSNRLQIFVIYNNFTAMQTIIQRFIYYMFLLPEILFLFIFFRYQYPDLHQSIKCVQEETETIIDDKHTKLVYLYYDLNLIDFY